MEKAESTHAATLKEEIDAYCKAKGCLPSSLGQWVLGNGRYYERLVRRLEKDSADAAKFRAYMAENPPPKEYDDTIIDQGKEPNAT